MMDVYSTFRKALFNAELYSSEEKGGKYVLKSGGLSISRLNLNPAALDHERYRFSAETEKNVKEIYSQVNNISMYWDLDSALQNDAQLQALLEKNGLANDFRISDIGGTINLVTAAQMFDRKEFGGFEKNGVEYLPFDLHYTLAICFKVEDEIKDNLYIFHTEDSDVIIDMKIGCQEYLRLAYQAKLLYQWQFAYLNKNGPHNKFLNTVLPEIFPFVELDLSDFRN